MKGKRTGVLLCLMVVFSAVAVFAAVTWHDGPNFSIQPFPNLLVTGTVTGLGGRVTVTVDANGYASGNCYNHGGNLPNPFTNISISASGSETVKAHNGGADVMLSATPNEISCPNPNWTPVITSVTYTSAEISIYNKNGGLFDQTYTLSGCSSTGSAVTCSY